MIEKNSFYYGVLPDLHCTVVQQITAGDRIVTQWEAAGTHQGEYAGVAPTGQSVTFRGISIFKCSAGKIVEQVISYDLLGLLKQLGVTTI